MTADEASSPFASPAPQPGERGQVRLDPAPFPWLNVRGAHPM
jgi:hypothetical protein